MRTELLLLYTGALLAGLLIGALIHKKFSTRINEKFGHLTKNVWFYIILFIVTVVVTREVGIAVKKSLKHNSPTTATAE